MSMDPEYDAAVYAANSEEWLSHRPICSECGEPITDETCFHIQKRYYCHQCMADFEEDIEE